MSAGERSPALRFLRIADPPAAWGGLGFTVQDNAIALGEVRLELVGSGRGIQAWGMTGIDAPTSIDGLATELADTNPAPPALEHQNGALGIDHVVVSTPDFDRTADALAEAGLGLRRVHRAPGSRPMGFRRLGPVILELVESPAGDGAAPAGFWGLVVTVRDLDALAQRLGQHLGPVHPAVQPGRRIASLRGSAGVSPAVAFMSPE
ncbi:MAG: VOC family protein [Solirubrobacteraceae bacterium]